MQHADNPLLQPYDLPPFSKIQAEHFSPALDQILAESRAKVAEIIETQAPFPTWDDLVLAMDEIHGRLKGFGYVLDRMASTRSGEAWARASLDCEERLDDFQRSLLRNTQLFQLYQRLADSEIAVHFSPVRKRTLKKILRQWHRDGMGSAAQETLEDLKARMEGARSLFLEHLHEANKAWSKSFQDEAALGGLPVAFKQQMARQAREQGQSGWLLTLDDESFRIVTRYADDSSLRKQMYIAYSTRASDQGPHAGIYDNGGVLRQLLKDRHEFATLLGYSNYAQMAIEPEQAHSPEEVLSFLNGQLEQHQASFDEDKKQLDAFARTQGFSKVEPWDYLYLAQQLRRQTAGVSEQDVSAWFPLEPTFARLLLVARDLFGVDIIERADVTTWHPQVRLFEVSERGETVGYFYFDPFEHADQNGFPQTSTLRNRRITAEGRPRYPVAVLNGWLPQGSAATPLLLDHRQLRVLFHELGHCLHHVLSRVEYRDVSGIIELSRDAAEFAGELFERWCFSKQFLIRVSKHHQTGASLPNEVADRLLTYLKTQTSWVDAGLLRAALFDMELHRSHGDGRTPQQVFDQVREQVGHLPAFENERWPNGLDYMVTGYDAGIYAYAWSRTLAKTIFKRFKRNGLFDRKTGKALRKTILERGDSRPLSESIADFLQATDQREGTSV
ncbi:M3 family metallopeptidase [Pseudomonas sp. D1-2]|uniref:M3 family metallopeptidase n=1 Tax=unclassified Pseudomonas TaxID=196821 RepID=UPI003DA8DB38